MSDDVDETEKKKSGQMACGTGGGFAIEVLKNMSNSENRIIIRVGSGGSGGSGGNGGSGGKGASAV